MLKQIKDNISLPEDKALLKIVNHNDTFYLESACYMPHASDIADNAKLKEQESTAPAEQFQHRTNNQEDMYLVVRSLKHQNEKVDYEI